MSSSERRQHDAYAKALLLRDAMRVAAETKLTANAQALLATLIAEAWPWKTTWATRMGMRLLAQRLSCSEQTLRRAARELEHAELVRRHNGKGRTISVWVIGLRRLRGSTGGRADLPPTARRPSTHGTSEVPPVEA